MSTIVLAAGLVLREGHRTFEIVRELEGDEFQLEDCLTRKPKVLRRYDLIQKIWNGQYVVVVRGSTGSEVTPQESIVALARCELTPIEEEEIARRLAYVRGLIAAHVTRGQRQRVAQTIQTTAKRLNDERPPSTSTLMLWARRYAACDNSAYGLLDGNRRRHRMKRTCPLVERTIVETLRRVYFTPARHSLRHAHEQIQTELKRLVENGQLQPDEAKVSRATVSRRANDVDLYAKISSREGPNRARMVCRTSMDGAAAEYPLQRVEVDHTPLNWVVICDRTGLPLGRPLLTVAVDAHSAYVLGLYVSFYGPGLTSVTGVIRNAVAPKDEFVGGISLKHSWLAYGLADEFVLDNGLEFHAGAFRRMSWDLGCNLMYCRVRTPWLKPHVERFFGTLNYLTLVRGRIHKHLANAMKIDPLKDAAISFSDLVKGLIMFVADVYPFEINERKLARPYDLYADGLARCPPAKFPGSLDQLRLTSAMSKELTVGPGGVDLRGIPYGGAELLGMRKRIGERFRTLVKWDPDDINQIYIQDPQDKSQWITSRSRWPDYTHSLAWNQHLIIRKFRRLQFAQMDAYEGQLAARQRLHEHWCDATSHRTRKDAMTAARYGGLTSARTATDTGLPAPLCPQNLLPTPEAPAAPIEIPTFDAFAMGHRR